MNLTKEEQKNLITQKRAKENLIDFSIYMDANYAVNWHHEIIAHQLERAYKRALDNKQTRIILEIPPRHGKSQLATINYPAWILGRNPELPIVVASYGQDLANEFGLDTRDLMQKQNYQTVFDTKLRSDTKAKANWLTEESGGYTAVGVGGALTGKGFKIGIVDDPIKDSEAAESETIRDKTWKWFTNTFTTRENRNTAIIVIMTRWHDDDLVGRIKESERANAWEIISFPAIAQEDEEYRDKGEPLWPEFYDKKFLDRKKADLGSYGWSSLYQQKPIDEEAQEFKEDWFGSVSWDEVKKKDTRKFATIDPALTKKEENDFTGVARNYIDKENNWNIKASRFNINSKDLVDLLFKLHNEGFEKIGIEEGKYKSAVEPFLEEEMDKRNKFINIETLRHKKTMKEARIRSLVPRYQNGKVFHIGDTCVDLEEELLRFPKSKTDDVMDALAYQSQIAEKPRKKQQYKQKPTRSTSRYYGKRQNKRYTRT